MVKKATPLERVARMLNLVPFLHTHQGISVDELASEFKVDRKELLEDLQALWMCGENKFDYMDLDFESEFVFVRNADALKAIRTLAGPERIALCLGLELLKSEIGESKLIEEIDGLITTLGQKISEQIAATPVISGSVARTIDEALTTRQALEITYYAAAEDQTTIRKVYPLAHHIQDGNEYLTCYCYLAGAQRTFRVDRIQNAHVVSDAVEPATVEQSPQPDVEASIRLHSDLRRSRESLGRYVKEDRDLLRVHFFSESWLIRTVFAGLGAVEVVGPVHLREPIHKRATELLRRYR